MRHTTLQTIAERLAEARIATFRYNFPYMEHGKGRDSQAVCAAIVRSAVAAAHRAAPDLPLIAHLPWPAYVAQSGARTRSATSE
jgi:uncharacterized protein